MNSHWSRTVVFLAIATLFTIWVNESLLALVKGERAGYFVHLAVVACLIIYALHLAYGLKTLTDRLMQNRMLLARLPCCLLIKGRETSTEIYGDRKMALRFGWSGLIAIGADNESACFLGKEEYQCEDGYTQTALRHAVQLSVGGRPVAAEFLYDISAPVNDAAARENDFCQMLKILVNMFEMKDPYNQGHSEHVSNLAQDLARRIALGPEEIDVITKAAILHDIGKIVIPPAILNKTVGFSANDWTIIRSHSEVGAEILTTMGTFHEAARIVRHHHEWYDGKGYPDGLVGGQIPLGARILSLADAFDAMTAGRSVRGRRNVEEALAEIRLGSGSQFDPGLAEVFIDMIQDGRLSKL